MNPYIENLKAFLAEQSPNFLYTDANSIIEMLFYYYLDANLIDNAVIRCQFRDLNKFLRKLCINDNDKVFSLATDLFVSHAKQAFTEAVLVGMRLSDEIQSEEC